MSKTGHSSLMDSYYFYASLLAVKYVCLKPMATLMCCPGRVLQASIEDLKYLTPFWVVAALYINTSPDEYTAKLLLRTYALARCLAAYGYLCKVPEGANQAAFFFSMAVTCYMAGYIIYYYRSMM